MKNFQCKIMRAQSPNSIEAERKKNITTYFFQQFADSNTNRLLPRRYDIN